MTVALIASIAILVPLALVDLVLIAEVALGLRSTRPGTLDNALAPRVALLLPAHNETATIARYGPALAALANARRRVVMVADNCTDTTAADAQALGIEVIERHDVTRRGKGFALAFGRDHLLSDPPEVAVILDADCLADPASIDLLAEQAIVRDRPVQGAYLFRSAPHATPSVQISNFAFALKNRIRQRGAQRIGAAAILTGSGMAFPWRLFAELELATDNVVEDLALGISLIAQGHPPIYEDRAIIWSDCSGESGTLIQRSRWEGGFLASARRHAFPLIAAGLARADWHRIWMGLHLLVPPLSLLMASNSVALVMLGGLAIAGASIAPVIVVTVLCISIGVMLGGAWLVEGRRHVSAKALLLLPRYLLWKLVLLLRIARGRQAVAWLRTERSDSH